MAAFLRNLFGKAPPTVNRNEPDTPSPSDPLPAPGGSADETLRRTQRLLRPVAAVYRRRLSQCGPTPKGAFWTSQENVLSRFEMLVRVFEATDAAQGGVTIRDFGCGYGALFDYLMSRPVMNDSRYIGYDITRSMLDACERRILDPRASFRHSARPTAQADYTIVSGTFNMKLDADEDAWFDYIRASLTLLWETTEKAMAFNLLDRRYLDPDMDGLYYADHRAISDFCRQALSPRVEVVENEGLPDFTVFVRR